MTDATTSCLHRVVAAKFFFSLVPASVGGEMVRVHGVRLGARFCFSNLVGQLSDRD
jgi:hypothetical protein